MRIILLYAGAGFAVASTALVGQSLGAELPEQAEEAGKISRNLAVLVMSTMAWCSL